MAIVMSDTSPILMLARVGQLELLPRLYGEVIIPPSVQGELIHERTDRSVDVAHLPWISVVAPRANLGSGANDLDPGESEAIALALEIHADILIVDDLRARKEARRLGVSITGLIGVLLQAKKQNLIAAIKPLLDELIDQGFHVSKDLYVRALATAKEG